MKTIAMVALMVMMLFQVGCLKTLDPKKEAIAAAKKYAGERLGLLSGGAALDGYQKESAYTDSTGATVIPPITRHEVLRKSTTVDLETTSSETESDDSASKLP